MSIHPSARRLAVLCCLVAAAWPAAAGAETLALAGGTVHPIVAEPYVGTVVVTDGVITAAGPEVAAPPEATVLDVAGLHVYPGLFDAMSQLGLLEIGAVSATDDRSELGAYNPHLQAATAIHPASEVLGVARANGITHALVAPAAGRDGVIPGQAALVHLDGWTVEEMAIEPSIAMIIQWPEVVTRRFDFATFSIKETPFQEAKEKADEQIAELRQWIAAARHYAQATAAGSTRVEPDLGLAALAATLDGGKKVIIRANAKRDIEAAIAFADKEGLEMILAGGRDAWQVTDLLVDKAIPVILGFTQSLPREEDDPYDRPFKTAGELAADGIEIALASSAGGGRGPGGPHSARTLPYEAAMAAAYGLEPDAALAALTLGPARILGVADRLGSIEPGKLGNLIVTDGSPLEMTTEVRHLVIDGREVSTDNRHETLYRRYRAR